MKGLLATLQPLGRALMLPIAVLPIAGMLLRLGQPDLLNITFVSAAGNAIFANLGLLFAIGIATAFARDGNGAACLAGVVCFLTICEGAAALVAVPPGVSAGLAADPAAAARATWAAAALAKLSVPIGIVSGLIGGNFYNRFSTIRLPAALGFFGGRRFVPIASGLAGLLIAALLGSVYDQISTAIDLFSQIVSQAGALGLFVFGLVNRLLLVTGLHHILNNVAWFVIGDYGGTTGDLRRFMAGDPTAGNFMSGFYPVMMFGLPAACLAMYHEALPERRRTTGSLLGSLALTSILTGITEPIEFSFLFIAPRLFLMHAVLTGVAMALMQVLGIRLGFGFSAGLFDYVLNFGKATRPWLLLPIGIGYAAIYYTMFRVTIRRFDLKTPGREPIVDDGDVPARSVGGGVAGADARGRAFVDALGGAGNLLSVGACTTRLRLVTADLARVNDAALKRLGARAVLRPGGGALQVVLGPIADQIAMEMRDAMNRPPARETNTSSAATNACATIVTTIASPALLSALGGPDNVRTLFFAGSRVVARLAHADGLDRRALDALGLRGVAAHGPDHHLLVDPRRMAAWKTNAAGSALETEQ